MPSITDQGVCVRQRDWSETSQTCVILAREHGILRALAKGSRRDKAPYSGGLEVLARADFTAITKPAGQLALLTTWDLAEPYPRCRADLPRFHASMYLADLVGRAIQDADPHPKLYDALVGALDAIGTHPPPTAPPEPRGAVERALLEFQWSLLVETGHKPELSAHAETGATPVSGRAYGFSPHLGGLVDDPGPSPRAHIWRVRPETIALLRALDPSPQSPPHTPPNPPLAADPAALTRAGRLLAWYTRERLEIDPPTLKLVYPDPAPSNPARR